MKKRKAQYWNMDRLVFLQASFTGVCPSTYFYRKMGIPSGYVFEGAPRGEQEG